ncbi:unnamed protein product [Lota lota]
MTLDWRPGLQTAEGHDEVEMAEDQTGGPSRHGCWHWEWQENRALFLPADVFSPCSQELAGVPVAPTQTPDTFIITIAIAIAIVRWIVIPEQTLGGCRRSPGQLLHPRLSV